VDAIIGFRKKTEKRPIKRVAIVGPNKDLIADLLEALIMTNSDVLARFKYIANVAISIISGRIRCIISGR
jgi:hypothetical protein